MNAYEELNRVRTELQGVLLASGATIAPSDWHFARTALDALDEVASRYRARQLQDQRELDRRAAALAESEPVEQVATFGVKGCPE